MPFRIQRPPTALNRLLSIFGGEGPSELEDRLRATIDARHFYAMPLLLTSTGAPTVGSIAPPAPLQEQLAITDNLGILAVGATLTMGAAGGTNIDLSINVQIGPTLGVPLGSQHYAALAATQNVRFGVSVPSWVMRAGTSFFVSCSGTAAGADHSLALVLLIENYNQL